MRRWEREKRNLNLFSDEKRGGGKTSDPKEWAVLVVMSLQREIFSLRRFGKGGRRDGTTGSPHLHRAFAKEKERKEPSKGIRGS